MQYYVCTKTAITFTGIYVKIYWINNVYLYYDIRVEEKSQNICIKLILFYLNKGNFNLLLKHLER